MLNNNQLTPFTKLEGEIKRGKIDGGLQAYLVHPIDNTSDVDTLQGSKQESKK